MTASSLRTRNDWAAAAATLSIATGLFIDGRHVPALGGETFDCVNPANGSVLEKMAKGQGGGGVLPRGIVNPLGIRDTAPRGVDDEFVKGISLEHRECTGGELRAVLRRVGRRDGEERLVGGEGIRVVLAGLVAGGWGEDTTVPCGDGAVGVGGRLSSERCKVFPETRGSPFGNGRAQQRESRHEAEGRTQPATDERRGGYFFHGGNERKGAREAMGV